MPEEDLIDNPLPRTPRGVCRFCECVENRACPVLSQGDGGHIVVYCSWVDQQHTVCSHPECLHEWCVALAVALQKKGEVLA